MDRVYLHDYELCIGDTIYHRETYEKYIITDIYIDNSNNVIIGWEDTDMFYSELLEELINNEFVWQNPIVFSKKIYLNRFIKP